MSLGCYTYVRNGLAAGYTFVEAIGAWRGLVDRFVVADGQSDDGTWEVLQELAEWMPELELVREEPAYLHQPKSVDGWQLGEVFEAARARLETTWQVMVQADCVFHPETVTALRLATEHADPRAGAFSVLRRQYRWNWQDMFLESVLNICTHRDRAVVMGDAMSCQVDGYADTRLLPLFTRRPVTDSAWCFWASLSGKVSNCAEIWTTQLDNAASGAFSWYDAHTGRDYRADVAAFETTGAVPPLFARTTSPFADDLPDTVRAWVGAVRYDPHQALQRVSAAGIPHPSEEASRAALAAPALVRTTPGPVSRARSTVGRALRAARLR